MAPEASLPKRRGTENQYIFDVGKRGRKTGLTVPDTGIRDENGLEPMDNLFSSPEKTANAKKTNGRGKNANATISSEEDMDVDESTVPEPTAVITERKLRASMRLPPPRSKSPIKTFLQSPARRNPSLGIGSSPVRGSIVEPKTTTASASVRRKLDFSSDNLDANVLESSTTNGSPQKRGNSKQKVTSAKLTNGTHLAPHSQSYSDHDGGDDQDDTVQTNGDEGFENGGDSFQMVDGGEDEEVEYQPEEAEEIPEPEPEPSKKAKGKAKAKEPEVPEVPVKRGRGRRPKELNPPQVEDDVEEPPAKRTRRSLDGPGSVLQPTTKAKPGRPSKNASTAKEQKPKPVGKKPKLAPIAEAESPQAQRGPPLPRNSRGLMIQRRETPANETGYTQTRAGRTSIKPLAFWKNERAEYSEDEMEDGRAKFLTSRIKSVVRVDEMEEKRRKRSYYRPTKGKGKQSTIAEESDDEEVEAWEAEPGSIRAPVRSWDPMDPTGIQVEEEEEEIALSSAAIITRDIAGASFKFAKTLTKPFFGSGMVDLPAHSEKKMKNSRRMQMVFFVYFGRVDVTVNDNQFGIGKGGMWQVPRGNTYSITNDSEKPARIFFAQGCEVLEPAEET